MTLKILAGEFGGRLLKAPKGTQTRPTTSLLRKAVFDILQTKISEAIFLDLFSGSGLMGIEALSRGAKQAIFIDNHVEAIRALKENLALLKIDSRAKILQIDVFKGMIKLQEMGIQCDIIYADPPYDKSTLYLELLKYLDLSPLLKPQGDLLLESPFPSPLEEAPMELKTLAPLPSRRYGASVLYPYIKKR